MTDEKCCNPSCANFHETADGNRCAMCRREHAENMLRSFVVGVHRQILMFGEGVAEELSDIGAAADDTERINSAVDQVRAGVNQLLPLLGISEEDLWSEIERGDGD